MNDAKYMTKDTKKRKKREIIIKKNSDGKEYVRIVNRRQKIDRLFDSRR